MATWDQATHRGASVNATLDPYYLCFLDADTPTVAVADYQAETVDLAADLSGNLISGVETPCIVTRPALVTSRPGGKFLNGQRRDIPVAAPYVRGMIGLSPGTPADHLAFLKAAVIVTGVWIVFGGAYPVATPGVWPFNAVDNDGRWQASAIRASSLTLKKQSELSRAELVTGAMNIELRYEGRLVGPLP